MFTRQSSRHKFRFIGYGILLLICYLLEVVPGTFPRVLGILPMLVLTVVVCVAMFEQEMIGGLFGMAGGLLLDVPSMSWPYFNALMFLIIGIFVGLATHYLIRNMLSTALILTTASLLFYTTVDWILFYVLPGIDRVGYFFLRYRLLAVIYTIAFVIPIYFLIRRLTRSAKT